MRRSCGDRWVNFPPTLSPLTLVLTMNPSASADGQLWVILGALGLGLWAFRGGAGCN